ncbi:MAG: hypothetical protein ACK4VO_11830 [Pseudobdellovibrio sp.]
MKKLLITSMILLFSAQSFASLRLTHAEAGLVYAFVNTVSADLQNAGDGVLVNSALISCTKHESNEQYYCMSDIGGLTGDIAKKLYNSMSKSTEENLDGVVLRNGNISCSSVSKNNKAETYKCDSI